MANEYSSGLTPWQRLRLLLRPERKDLRAVLVYGVAVSFLSLVVPITAQALVNVASFGTVLQPVLVLTVIAFAFLFVAGWLQALQVWMAELIQQRVFTRLSMELSYRLPRIQVEAYDRQRGTEMVNRFLEVATVQKGASLLLLDGFTLSLQTATGMLLLALYNPLLLGFDLVLLLCIAGVLFGLGRGAVKSAVAESDAKYKVVAWLEELARVPVAFKEAQGARFALSRTDSVTHRYLDERRGHFRVLFRQTIGTLAVQALASAVLLGIGGFLVTRQQLTLGQLVAAELVVTPVVAGFAKFGKHLETLYDVLGAMDKLGLFFDLPLERMDGEPMPAASKGPASLKLRQVGFTYPAHNRPVLEAAELHIQPGERVAVLGLNGSGKTTLVDLALGLRQPDRGAVELDGVDLRNLSTESFRSQVASVRGVEIFEGTVLENLRVGRDHPLSEVRTALEAVGLWEQLMLLPEGLGAKLSGNSSSLSAGQGVRLMLARALLGKPRFLVLDEVLDQVDPVIRSQVVQALFAEGSPWSLLITTHVPELASRCDRVIRLQGGLLIEETRQ